MERFPLDRNGKVDLRALGALFAPAAGADRGGGQPVAVADPSSAAAADPVGRAADDAEELIRDVWTEVLGTDDFGFDEAFFDVGGDSLTLAMVRTRLERRLVTRPISLAELYRYPTVQSLAQHLRTT